MELGWILFLGYGQGKNLAQTHLKHSEICLRWMFGQALELMYLFRWLLGPGLDPYTHLLFIPSVSNPLLFTTQGLPLDSTLESNKSKGEARSWWWLGSFQSFSEVRNTVVYIVTSELFILVVGSRGIHDWRLWVQKSKGNLGMFLVRFGTGFNKSQWKKRNISICSATCFSSS